MGVEGDLLEQYDGTVNGQIWDGTELYDITVTRLDDETLAIDAEQYIDTDGLTSDRYHALLSGNLKTHGSGDDKSLSISTEPPEMPETGADLEQCYRFAKQVSEDPAIDGTRFNDLDYIGNTPTDTYLSR